MTRSPFIHRIAIYASDFAATERMLTAALRELDIHALFRSDGIAEYWHADEDGLSISVERAPSEHVVTRRVHIAFAARTREEVDRFHDAAVSNGARSKHPPRFWQEYRAYCAFLRDPDGNKRRLIQGDASSIGVGNRDCEPRRPVRLPR